MLRFNLSRIKFAILAEDLNLFEGCKEVKQS